MKSLVVQGLEAWFDFDIIADLVDECRSQVPYTVMYVIIIIIIIIISLSYY